MTSLFFNGDILTGNEKQPFASAFLVEDGVIKAVGHSEDFNLSGVTKVDLQGKTVLPAFNDAHIHLWKIGQLDSFIIDLRGVDSIETIRKKIKDETLSKPRGTWIVGRGFNEAVLKEKRMPQASDLDDVAPDHPVYLIRTCAHIAVTNNAGLDVCGITEETVVPEGGAVGRSDGKINGRLFENALALVTRHLPEITTEDYQSMIRSGAEKMLKAGITSLTDPAVHPELMEAYQRTAGPSLGLRLNLMPMMMPDGGDKTYPLPQVEKNFWKRITTAKLFADGGLSGATAAMSREDKGSRGHGILRISDDRLHELVRIARAAGFSTGIHAIGDRAISQVLDIYDQTTKEFGPCRNRIEHFGLPTEKNLEDAARLQVVAVPQAIFLNELGENFIDALDDAYLEKCYPLQSLLQKNIQWAMSTDAPVVKDFNPWKNIQTAITRKTTGGQSIAPQEAISMNQALAAYTAGSAFAEGTESFKGNISEGKLADFIITDRNPSETPVEELPEINVLSTFTGGIEVYKK